MADTATLTQYLTFTLGTEVYALEVSHVREVLEVIPITHLPRTVEHMRGVINVRGTVVPVLDLRLRFGLSRTENTVNTCIVVLDVVAEGTSVVLGALVDSVQEVVDFDSTQIEPAPRIGSGRGTDYLQGIGKRGDTFILILDIREVFSREDIEAVADVEAAVDSEHGQPAGSEDA